MRVNPYIVFAGLAEMKLVKNLSDTIVRTQKQLQSIALTELIFIVLIRLVSHKILNTPRHGLDMVDNQFVKIAILVLLIDDKLTSCLLVTDRCIRLKHI